jgi:cobalt-zinc-cadmium efflux system outer membrane protein
MPNPTVGFEADTTGTTGGAGYVGGFVEQVINTANKLQLSRAAAAFEIKLAELELINVQADLATTVRGGYFAVLVAQESVRLNRALVRFTTDVYNLQVDQVRRGGFAAPYEPMFLRALATQARAALVQARNRRTAAWKQLAASLGLPGMPPTQLAGRLDVPVPAFDHKHVLNRALSNHTAIRSAEVALAQAKLQLELERRTPIPDVNLRVMVQKDNTGPPFQASPSVAVGFPIPVWDKNQGNILTAQAAIDRVGEEMHKARVDLTSRLAEAFERYENNRVILGYYRDQILPDLVRVYRGVYDRYQRDPGGAAGQPPAFTDVVVAQQNLAQAVATYVTTLGSQWQAAVDVADVMQTFDLFGVEKAKHPVAEIPDLVKLPPLPCHHACSPLPHAHQHVVDRGWPPAERAAPLPPPVEALPAPRLEHKEDKPKAGAKQAEPRPAFDPLLLEPPPVTSPRH